MKALNKKLFRDLWHHRGQMFSIAAVVATAIMTVLSMRGTYESLVIARDSYYHESRFPDVWSNLERAPELLRGQIEQIEGVTAVDTRVTFAASLDLDDRDTPATGRFISASDPSVMLGALHMRSGRWVTGRDRDRVMISEKFALANEFIEGDTLRAVINGRLRNLEIIGIAISPEHSYAVPAGALFPDDANYGIVWMSREAIGSVFDMEGAFNEVVLTLASNADVEGVMLKLNRILEPYGGLGSYGREFQLSNLFLENELKQNRTMGTAIPAIFLAVVAFLLNMVLRRLISTQRQEIAVLKAFGYSNVDIGLFYLQFALTAVLAGAVIGIGIGAWLGGVMVELYKDYFVFPDLHYELSAGLVAFAIAISVIAAIVGALGGVKKAINLPPAEAMRPQAPARFAPGIFERLGLAKYLHSSTRMVLRNIERRPIKSLFSALGVSFSVAILITGMFMFDGVDRLMDLQFNVAQREDLSVTFNRSLGIGSKFELGRIKGVASAEMFRMVPVRISKGHRERESGITGRALGDELSRIVDSDGRIIPMPLKGLVVSKVLADQLEVVPGDRVQVEVLEGARVSRKLEVVSIVDDLMGMSVYMNIVELHRLVGGPRMVSGASLASSDLDHSQLSGILGKLPAIASVTSPRKAFDLFDEQMSKSMYIGIFFLIGFSSIIAVSVIYNGARIALSERGRELASLRVLGFSKREVAVLLFSEQGLITLFAIPIGWYIGYLFAQGIVLMVPTETFRIPLVVDAGTYFLSTVVTIAAAIGSFWIVRRRLNNYDLISVLKTRD